MQNFAIISIWRLLFKLYSYSIHKQTFLFGLKKINSRYMIIKVLQSNLAEKEGGGVHFFRDWTLGKPYLYLKRGGGVTFSGIKPLVNPLYNLNPPKPRHVVPHRLRPFYIKQFLKIKWLIDIFIILCNILAWNPILPRLFYSYI